MLAAILTSVARSTPTKGAVKEAAKKAAAAAAAAEAEAALKWPLTLQLLAVACVCIILIARTGVLAKLRSVQWTGPAIWLGLITAWTFLTSFVIILRPDTSRLARGRHETMMGWSSGMFCALINGAAQDMCAIQLLPLGLAIWAHYSIAEMSGTVVDCVIWAGYFYFGVVHTVKKTDKGLL